MYLSTSRNLSMLFYCSCVFFPIFIIKPQYTYYYCFNQATSQNVNPHLHFLVSSFFLLGPYFQRESTSRGLGTCFSVSYSAGLQAAVGLQWVLLPFGKDVFIGYGTIGGQGFDFCSRHFKNIVLLFMAFIMSREKLSLSEF